MEPSTPAGPAERPARGAPNVENTRVGWRRLGQLNRGLSDRQRDRILAELFIRKDSDFMRYLWRFCLLLCLSTIIAAFGLLSNSTAVVIGAMLVVEGWAHEAAAELHLKNYVYFAMAFSVIVDFLQLRLKSKENKPVTLHNQPSLTEGGD